MKTFGNLLWCIFGGGLLAVMWSIVGIICMCTIIAIPMGIQCFKFASLTFWPFGRDVVFSNSIASFALNVIWIMIFGWSLTIMSCAVGAIYCITIVGIPFGLQCFKFAKLAILPFGADIVKI